MEKMMEKKRNRMRIPIALLLVLTMMLTLGAAPSFAAAPSKEEVKYLGKGKVEVEFYGDVAYKNVKVAVKDTSGKTYKASIYKKDDDELRFKVKNYKSGKRYNFTISGVRERGTDGYGNVTGSFKIKKAKTKISVEEVKYLGKGKVEVEFYRDVAYKNAKVTVKDTSGKSYDASIYKKDDDELRFKVKDYKAGKTYKFTISGVKKIGAASYGKASGTFKIKKASSGITAAEAQAIALKDAGLTASQVWGLEVEKDRDDGVTKYEISFEANGYEYDYEISMTGKILKKEKERD